MPDLDELNKYTDLVVRLIPILALLLLWLKPVRNRLGKWFSELVTFDVRSDMNKGFDTINTILQETKVALTKSEKLQTRRHNANQREIKAIKEETVKIGDEVKKRMDDHLIDHGKESDSPTDIP